MARATAPPRRAGRLPYGHGCAPTPRAPRSRTPGPRTWTPEWIVAALREWARVVGGPPRSYDWNPSLARALGRESAASRRWDAEHPRWPHANTVYAHWGSWSKALVAAGLPATVREFDLPVAERVAAARRLAADGATNAAIARSLGVDRRTVRNYLAAGDCALCATPLASPAARHCSPCAGAVQQTPPRWTVETIVEAMRRWEHETGLQPTVRMWGSRRAPTSKWHSEQPRWPSAGQVIAACGSWGQAQRLAGLAPLKRGWTREEAISALQRAARETGRVPRCAEWARATADRPPATTVRNLFGSWRAALHAAGLA
jgi:hypothetical protein